MNTVDLVLTDRPPATGIPDLDVDELVAHFDRKLATVAVIGLGYVGLPLSLAACHGGFRVRGFDVNKERVAELNLGRSPLQHIHDDRIGAVRRSQSFEATSDPERLREADALIICVPTPLGPHREPDLSFVEQTARMLANTLRRGQLIVLESTTYPGTTRGIVKPILEKSGLRSGRDFLLAYSPEREDPGNGSHETSCIPKIVAGEGAAALRLTRASCTIDS